MFLQVVRSPAGGSDSDPFSGAGGEVRWCRCWGHQEQDCGAQCSGRSEQCSYSLHCVNKDSRQTVKGPLLQRRADIQLVQALFIHHFYCHLTNECLDWDVKSNVFQISLQILTRRTYNMVRQTIICYLSIKIFSWHGKTCIPAWYVTGKRPSGKWKHIQPQQVFCGRRGRNILQVPTLSWPKKW